MSAEIFIAIALMCQDLPYLSKNFCQKEVLKCMHDIKQYTPVEAQLNNCMKKFFVDRK